MNNVHIYVIHITQACSLSVSLFDMVMTVGEMWVLGPKAALDLGVHEKR